MQKCLIMYCAASGQFIGDTLTTQADHWDACRYGWDHIPDGAVDFQVIGAEEYFQLTGANLLDDDKNPARVAHLAESAWQNIAQRRHEIALTA